MPDFDKLGSFYLGRKHDLAAGETQPDPVLYDSKDLTTHAVCVGMTGSGKTGLCLSLIEEAALDGIPIIAIDPKGDLGNLLLSFPELRPSDFRPWVDPAVASQKGITPDELAEQTAELWRTGLNNWGEDGARIERFNSAVEKTIYTPGSSAGVPLTVLKSFTAPPQAVVDDNDAFLERVQATTSGLLALLGIDADPVRSREHIFLSKLLDEAWRAGRSLDLAGLIQEIQQPPFKQVGVIDLEKYFPAKDRFKLGLELNNLLASPSFASWLEGEPLDVQRLLYTTAGQPRLSILSIAHLSDAERMFFVTILLGEVISWMRSQSGTGSLRALLYMDEVFGYFPPTANPPSKRPMLTLLKQARAYGLGVVLATQNPVDLDYKGLSNAGTWFLGRLQTERDKMRVLEGLEGASAQAGSSFNRGEMEATLAALGSRVFLMNNVHDDHPQVFHTRWAMSYLGGPLTRDQIRTLMADRKAELTANSKSPSASTVAGNRPVTTADIAQRFWPINSDLSQEARVQYRPALLGYGKVHFARTSLEIDYWRDCVVLQTVHDKLREPVWDSAMVFEQTSEPCDDPVPGARFVNLPSPLANEKNYAVWEKELADHLYSSERLVGWRCEALDENSLAKEPEEDFRSRLTKLLGQLGNDVEEKRVKVRKRYEKRIKDAEKSLTKAKAHYSEQRNQFLLSIAGVVPAIVMLIPKLLTKGSNKRMSFGFLKKPSTELGQAWRARKRLKRRKVALKEFQRELQEELDQLEPDLDPTKLELEEFELSPIKGDMRVDRVELVWMPWHTDASGTAQPAY